MVYIDAINSKLVLVDRVLEVTQNVAVLFLGQGMVGVSVRR